MRLSFIFYWMCLWDEIYETSRKFYFAAFALNQKSLNIKRGSKSSVNNSKIVCENSVGENFLSELGELRFSHSQLLLRIVVNIKWKFSSKYANMLSKVQQGLSSPTLFPFHFAVPITFHPAENYFPHNIFIMKIPWVYGEWITRGCSGNFPTFPLIAPQKTDTDKCIKSLVCRFVDLFSHHIFNC